MHVEPSKQSFRPSRSNDTEPSEEQASFANKDITILPDELLVKIFSSLDLGDLTHCQLVNRRWQKIIDDQMLAPAFYHRCHPIERQTNPLTVEHYHSSIRGWLAGFSNLGRELAARLDKFLQHKHFSGILFFSIAKVLAKAKALTCQDVGTITNSYWLFNTSFSPDGGHLVTVSLDGTAKIWRLVNDQWQEETIIEHSGWVKDVCFSPDGKGLVTASRDRSIKLWRLVNGQCQWQEEDTIRHSDYPVNKVRFSPDGKRLVAASTNAAKIWELVGDQLQEETTIEHSGWVHDVCFSPDGKCFVTASCDRTAKIWRLVNGQWQEETIIHHSGGVNDVCFSPDGTYLAIAAADTSTIWKLVDGEWEETAAIKHVSLVSKLSFSPDGNHFLVVYYGGPIVKVCGVVDGQWQEKATITSTGSVRNISFSPDGHHLVTISDHVTTVWVLKSKENADSC